MIIMDGINEVLAKYNITCTEEAIKKISNNFNDVYYNPITDQLEVYEKKESILVWLDDS
jgi:uncharacterized protein YpuA (DUF1002 family)